MTRVLDFIVIGASKSGTTSLFHHLREHPQLALPVDKEAPFFSNDDWYSRGWQWYIQEHFRDASPHQQLGTVTPQYLEDGHRSAPRMYSQLPDVRIIVLLRSPVERTYSAYRMRAMKGRELRDFGTAVEDQLEPSALSYARELPYDIAHATETYIVTSEYARMLKYYLKFYDTSQIQLFFTENFAKDPLTTVSAVFKALGVDSSVRPSNLGKRYFVGGTGRRGPGMVGWLRQFRIIRWLWRQLDHEQRKAILFWYRTEVSVRRGGKGSPIPQDVRLRLEEFYKGDILELEERFNVITPWYRSG